MRSRDGDDINIWLAYSDLFSAVAVILLAILVFGLLPARGSGDGQSGTEEFKRRQDAQWRITEKLFNDIHSRGYAPEPLVLENVKERFYNRTPSRPDLVRFSDNQGNEAVAIFRPEGEEQRLTFGSQVLFENEGPYLKKIKLAGLSLLRTVGAIILSQDARTSEIRVIGHTDVKPPKQGYSVEYNWVLSSERAIEVVNTLLTDPEIAIRVPLGIREDNKQYKRESRTMNFPPNRISAIGRGEFEPLGSVNEDWKERQKRIYKSWDNEKLMSQNRRIEIILKYLPMPE
jgi:flagellar motor protein MotB